MKIAVWHNLQSGGAKRALYHQVKGLVERGHTLVCYCPDTIDQNFLPLSELAEEHILPLKETLKQKTKRYKIFNSYANIYERTQAMLEHCRECAEQINKGGFDLLFANSSSDFYMAHIGRFVNLPKIIYLGEPYRYMYEAIPEFLWKAPSKANISSVKYILARLLHLRKIYRYSYLCREEYQSAQCYDFILVNSFFSRESVKRAYNLDSKVCYLGINTQHFNSANITKEGFVLGVGYIHRTKGIELAIESISYVSKEKRPPLIWVGNNPHNSEYINDIERLAKEKDVEVILKRYVPDEELLALYSKASVFLYLPNLEPFGLAPLEANACGTGVISIAEGGLRETIKHEVNGFLVNDASPKKIAEYVSMFTTNLDFASKFGAEAKIYIKDKWGYEAGINNIEYWLKMVKNIGTK